MFRWQGTCRYQDKVDLGNLKSGIVDFAGYEIEPIIDLYVSCWIVDNLGSFSSCGKFAFCRNIVLTELQFSRPKLDRIRLA